MRRSVSLVGQLYQCALLARGFEFLRERVGRRLIGSLRAEKDRNARGAVLGN